MRWVLFFGNIPEVRVTKCSSDGLGKKVLT